MNKQRRGISSAFSTLVVVLGLPLICAGNLSAQDRPNTNLDIEGIKWTVLQQMALANMPGKDEIMGMAEIAPGAAAERHSHVEHELGYLVQGEFDLEIEGAPTQTVRAGDSYSIPAGKVHRAKNNGSEPIKVLAIYILEQGRPLAMPAQ